MLSFFYLVLGAIFGAVGTYEYITLTSEDDVDPPRIQCDVEDCEGNAVYFMPSSSSIRHLCDSHISNTGDPS